MPNKNKPKRNAKKPKSTRASTPKYPKLTCPLCKSSRNYEGTVVQAYFSQQMRVAPTAEDIRRSVSHLTWACAECLKKGKALRANLQAQHFGMWTNRLCYIDEEKVCTDCGEDFRFAASEQRYWYEVLKFNPGSHPKQCPPCRGKRRAQKRERLLIDRELGELLALPKPGRGELERMHELYLAIGHTEKAELMARRIANLSPKKD